LAERASGQIEIITQPGVGYRLELRGAEDAPERESEIVTAL
jgi:hypothetical protein